MNRVVRCALVAAILLPDAVARADIPPPANYVETCTLDQQCPDGTTCSGHDEASVECAKAAASAGKEERCRSWGASSGVTVYCPPGSKPPPPSTSTATTAAPNDPKGPDPKVGKGGCASCAIRPSSRAAIDGAALVAVVGLVFATALRSRRRRR